MAALAATRNLISIDEALRLVLERVERLPAEPHRHRGRVRPGARRGRGSAVDLPPFDSSAMDGFALRSSDTPGRLPVVHRIPAGTPAPRSLEAGEAMGIATGAVVPEGADAVIPFEYVVENDNAIEIEQAVERGANVRPAGGDIGAGETVVEAGARLEARAPRCARGCGHPRGSRRSEAAGRRRGDGQRAASAGRDAGSGTDLRGERNSARGAAGLGRGRGREGELGCCDEEAAHREALARGLDADVLVTSGGVSVGPHDLVRAILAELGVEEVFWGVSVKPGKPISFGVAGDRLVFGLPGNPVSVLVGFELFVRPALLALQGERRSRPPVRARSPRLAADAESRPRRARARPGSAAVRRPGRRPAGGSRVAHDRASRRGGCARPHSTWKRRCRRRARPSSSCGSRDPRPAALARRGACGFWSASNGPAHQSSRRAEARPFGRGRIRRIPADGDRRELCRDGEPRAADEERRELDVADSRQLREVPRRVQAKPQSRGERAYEQRPARGTRRRAPPAGSEPAWFRAWGSQIHACSDGSTKMTAYGFIATIRSESTASASSAATWPESSSPSPDGRRGTSRSRAKSQPSARRHP